MNSLLRLILRLQIRFGFTISAKRVTHIFGVDAFKLLYPYFNIRYDVSQRDIDRLVLDLIDTFSGTGTGRMLEPLKQTILTGDQSVPTLLTLNRVQQHLRYYWQKSKREQVSALQILSGYDPQMGNWDRVLVYIGYIKHKKTFRRNKK